LLVVDFRIIFCMCRDSARVGYLRIHPQLVCNFVLHHCWLLVCELIVTFCSAGPALVTACWHLAHIQCVGGVFVSVCCLGLRSLSLCVETAALPTQHSYTAAGEGRSWWVVEPVLSLLVGWGVVLIARILFWNASVMSLVVFGLHVHLLWAPKKMYLSVSQPSGCLPGMVRPTLIKGMSATMIIGNHFVLQEVWLCTPPYKKYKQQMYIYIYIYLFICFYVTDPIWIVVSAACRSVLSQPACRASESAWASGRRLRANHRDLLLIKPTPTPHRLLAWTILALWRIGEGFSSFSIIVKRWSSANFIEDAMQLVIAAPHTVSTKFSSTCTSF